MRPLPTQGATQQPRDPNPRHRTRAAKRKRRALADARPLYAPFTWGHFRKRRFEGDFADEGRPEIQIADFLLPVDGDAAP